ncbi:CT583 family protein [Simkania negevensis]|uniref:CT583 family protein n=1 Tax=Simkania negevensis TaxID=83561 RepID=A0ABS3ATX2_9BACT|nr:CT583 family protein [Simkania negevensis]
MSKVNSFLSKRLKNTTEKNVKMAQLAEKSADGGLNSFAGVFGLSKLNQREKDEIEELLNLYKEEHQDIDEDLQRLIEITSEVKAISNQAALLHGERIKRAQVILTRYRDGAFSSWLVAVYGNRQTPYNFLQYFEFFRTMPRELHPQIESMPRQAVYTLASRSGPDEMKADVVKDFQGETKQELLLKIRQMFPLAESDGRRQDMGAWTTSALKRVYNTLNTTEPDISETQKEAITKLLEAIKKLVTH